MSEFIADFRDFNECVRVALTESANLTYGVKSLPFADEAPWAPAKCRQPASMLDYIVDVKDLDTKPAALLTTLQPTEVRQIIAGTGVGKSTKMPVKLVESTGSPGIILFHDDMLPYRAMAFVNSVKSQWGSDVTLKILNTKSCEYSLEGPVLYYASVKDFLALLVVKPDLVTSLGLEFIYLDESHVDKPEYKMIRYLVAMKKLVPAKVLYGTATGASDVSKENANPLRNVVLKPSSQFLTASVDNVPYNSQLHYEQIRSKVMVFLANDEECARWAEYYESYDVPSFVYAYGTRSTQFSELEVFLREYQACVVLVTSRVETGYTFDIDVVIDTGYTTRVDYDVSTGAIKSRRDAVTKVERIQRAARVGRFKRGTAIVADIKFSEYSALDDDLMWFYVYLWSIVLNITINNPIISRFKDATGEITRLAAAILLNAKIPAPLVLPYIANTGCFEGFAVGMKAILHCNKRFDSGEYNDQYTKMWPTRTTGNMECLVAPIDFKAPSAAPKSWALPLCYVWLKYKGASFRELTREEIQTVIGDDDSLVVKRKKPKPPMYTPDSGYTVRASGSKRMSRYDQSRDFAIPKVSQPVLESSYVQGPAKLDRHTIYDNVDSLHHRSKSYELPYHKRDTSDNKILPQPLEQPPRYSQDNVGQWLQDVKPLNKRRLSKSSGSSGEAFERVYVDLMKNKFHKFFPLDQAMFERFLENQKVIERDFTRYKELHSLKVRIPEIARQPTRVDDMERYWFSIIRVHNYAVVSFFQSQGADSPTGFQKFFGNSRVIDYEPLVLRTTGLLKTFELEHLQVGIHARHKHCASSSVGYSPTFDDSAAKGQFYLELAPTRVGVVVDVLRVQAVPVLSSSGIVSACAWHFGSYVLSTYHVYVQRGIAAFGDLVSAVASAQEDNDIILFSANTVGISCLNYGLPRYKVDVLVVAHDPLSCQSQVHGPYVLTGGRDVWYIDKSFEEGYSGALVISAHDGTIYGMYTGLLHSDAENSYGEVKLVSFLLDSVK